MNIEYYTTTTKHSEVKMSNNKQSMKLYTEEEVKKGYLKGWMDGESDRYSNDGLIEAIDSLTPIELPSDEEIWDEGDKEDNNGKHYAFMRGAKWMRNKIQGGNNEQQ